jgi:hypothetical protein
MSTNWTKKDSLEEALLLQDVSGAVNGSVNMLGLYWWLGDIRLLETY